MNIYYLIFGLGLLVLLVILAYTLSPVTLYVYTTTRRLWNRDKLHVCAKCRGVVWETDSHKERMSTGNYVWLCEDCHNDIFNPFSKYGGM